MAGTDRHHSPELEAFFAECTAQMAPHTGSKEFVEANPGVHIWGTMRSIESCLFCGLCRRGDGKPQSPCKGIARISLR